MKHDISKQLADLKAADAETLEKLAETAPADDRALARMLEAAERRADGIPTEDLRLVTAQRHAIWPRAAMIAMGLLVCGAAGTGIVHLTRIAPVPEEDVLETTAPAVTEEPADLADAVSADMAETDVPAETSAPRTTAVSVTTDAPALVVLEAPATTAAQTTAAATSSRTSTKTVAKTAARATETVPAVQTEAPATAAPAPVTTTAAPVTTEVPATTMTTAETATTAVETTTRYSFDYVLQEDYVEEDTESVPGYWIRWIHYKDGQDGFRFRWLEGVDPSPDGPMRVYYLDRDGWQMKPAIKPNPYEIVKLRYYTIEGKEGDTVYKVTVTQTPRTEFTGFKTGISTKLTPLTIGGHPALLYESGRFCGIFYDDGAYTFEMSDYATNGTQHLIDICAALTRDDSALDFDAETYAALMAVREAGDQAFGIYLRQEAVIKGELPADAPRLTYESLLEIIAAVEAQHADDIGYVHVLNRYGYILDAVRELYPYPDFEGGSGTDIVEFWCGDTDDEKIVFNWGRDDITYRVKQPDGTVTIEQIPF
ncbi:MAG: hypothetical protein IKI21_06570 [Oscillospiraceae bacterium]|nr:hypothetical protein [Oscillospiraceae bacterium]